MPNANSWVMSLPSSTVPASCQRCTQVASSSGTQSARSAEPPVVRMPLRQVDVLVGDRHAEQRTVVAAPQRLLGGAGVGERAVGRERDEGVEHGVELLDPGQQRARHLDR